MRRTVTVPAGSTILLAAALGALVGAKAGIAAQPCRSLVVASAEETRGAASEKFSATKTTDLTFRLFVDPALSGDHVLELKVFTPHTFLYRSIAVPIALGAAASAAAAQERSVDGYPRPQRVRRATRDKLAGADVQKVEVAFPVGGTDIVGNSLYGKWKVEPFLDGATDACGPAASFRITP
jgi:hypothetical protein